MGSLSVLGEECALKDCEVSYGVKVDPGGTGARARAAQAHAAAVLTRPLRGARACLRRAPVTAKGEKLV